MLFTHDHADHTHGIDDLRPLVIHMRRRIPVYADAATSRVLHERFGYCFKTPPGSEYPPILDEHRIAAGRPVTIDGPGRRGHRRLPFEMIHGNGKALGLRFGDLAYASDVSAMPDESFAALDGSRRADPRRAPLHAASDPFLGLRGAGAIARVKPRRAVLTNLHTDVDYARLASEAAGRRRAGLRRHADRERVGIRSEQPQRRC